MQKKRCRAVSPGLTEAGCRRALVLQGPNLNLLGQREVGIYPAMSLDDLHAALHRWGAAHGYEVECLQSNHEGVLVDALHAAQGRHDFVVLNAGAYTHTSIALRDAIAAIGVPVFEVHMSNIYAREGFRHTSMLAAVCRGQISGLGEHSYLAALQAGACLYGGALW